MIELEGGEIGVGVVQSGGFTDVNVSPGQAFPVIGSLLHSHPCGWLCLFVSLPWARGAPQLAGGSAFLYINWVSLH